MAKYKVTFERTQFYTLEIEASSHDEACNKAEEMVKANELDGVTVTFSDIDLTDCWAERLDNGK